MLSGPLPVKLVGLFSAVGCSGSSVRSGGFFVASCGGSVALTVALRSTVSLSPDQSAPITWTSVSSRPGITKPISCVDSDDTRSSVLTGVGPRRSHTPASFGTECTSSAPGSASASVRRFVSSCASSSFFSSSASCFAAISAFWLCSVVIDEVASGADRGDREDADDVVPRPADVHRRRLVLRDRIDDRLRAHGFRGRLDGGGRGGLRLGDRRYRGGRCRLRDDHDAALVVIDRSRWAR